MNFKSTLTRCSIEVDPGRAKGAKDLARAHSLSVFRSGLLCCRVWTDERCNLALTDTEAHVVENVDLAIVHVDAAKLEHADGQDKLR